ncbi:SDR family NAD(P)-dependent oxidoreductase [Ruegeria sp. HKCCD7255]|uniref:SDR family NAD(P)-dependent oxidoreductase n=1 Tax=Ruegeria sp. HKCCD7255 TaxID=2683004 RepID=UPI001489AB1A
MTTADLPSEDFSGKHVIVTGGATGIGASIVAAFARRKAQVSFLDNNVLAGERLAQSLGDDVHFADVDLSDVDRARDAIDHLCETAGRIDVLVNNAANDTRHATQDVTPESWRNTLAINLDHKFFCSQTVLPKMQMQGHGVILNFGSIAWRVGLADAVGYVTAKAAIEGLTRALAQEGGPFGVRVNCLLPGFVRTERQVEKWLTPESSKLILEQQCLKRFIEPEEIADVAVFLCSDAARAITKQTIVVDAGWS